MKLKYGRGKNIEVKTLEWYNCHNYLIWSEVKTMKDILKQIRADLMISSIICIIFGIILLFRPIETVSVFCRILAVIMIVVGGMFMFSYFLNWMSSGLSAAMGLIVALIGIWIFVSPEIIMTLIPIVIGVVLLFHGLQGVKMAWESKSYGVESWTFSMVLAIISLVFGVLCIIDAFQATKAAMQLLGIALIYNGVSNLLITTRTTKAAKEFNKNMEPVDVEAKDIDE